MAAEIAKAREWEGGRQAGKREELELDSGSGTCHQPSRFGGGEWACDLEGPVSQEGSGVGPPNARLPPVCWEGRRPALQQSRFGLPFPWTRLSQILEIAQSSEWIGKLGGGGGWGVLEGGNLRGLGNRACPLVCGVDLAFRGPACSHPTPFLIPQDPAASHTSLPLSTSYGYPLS